MELLDNHAAPLSAVQIATALDIPRTSCANLLKSLQARGYLHSEYGSRDYSLTVRAFALGTRALAARLPVERFTRVLRQLSIRTGERVSVFLQHASVGTCAMSERASAMLDETHPPYMGYAYPMHLGAAGRAILSTLAPADRARWIARLRMPGAYPANLVPALEEELDLVKAQGYCFIPASDGQGLATLGAALPARQGHPRMALELTVDAQTWGGCIDLLVVQVRQAIQDLVEPSKPLRPVSLIRKQSPPLNIIVPFPPGGSADHVGRTIAHRLQEELGRPVRIVNLSGQSGTAGAALVARAAPDGNHLLLGTAGTQGAGRLLFERLTYDPLHDFLPVGLLAELPAVLSVRNDLPVRTVAELVRFSQGHHSPLRCGTEGPRTLSHRGADALCAQSRMRVKHVSFDGASAAVLGLSAGRLDMTITGAVSAIQHARIGTLRILAVLAPWRMAAIPAVPTLAELGYPEYPFLSWAGLFAPRGADKGYLAELGGLIEQLVLSRGLAEEWNSAGLVPLPGSAHLLRDRESRDVARWRQLLPSVIA